MLYYFILISSWRLNTLLQEYEPHLAVAKSKITVFFQVVHHFKWSEISRVRAVSPWEIIVTQYLIGKPDMSYNIVTVHTPSILSKVTRLAGSKIEYMEPPPHALDPNTDSKVLDLSG